MYKIVHYTEYPKDGGRKCDMCGVSYTAQAFTLAVYVLTTAGKNEVEVKASSSEKWAVLQRLGH
jgi:hypothetical protein